MAGYTQVRYGSTGSAVKDLQEKLNAAGNYGLQTDGVFGAKTQAAVKDYQSKSGLKVDGVAGNDTWGSLNSRSAAAPSTTATVTPVAQQTAAQTPSYRYDAEGDPKYQAALEGLKAAQANKPVYAGTYDQQLSDIYNKIMGRQDFSYDLNGDALWQQYKDQSVQLGKMAMMDTMGQAAALTGGYGSTYAQNVGQQAYQSHLQQLTDKVPELYQLALSKYQMEGDRLADQFAMTGQLQADEYGRYQDALGQHNIDLDRAQSAADTAYDRGSNAWYTEQQLKNQAEETAYSRQQDAYSKLADLITSTGYTPSATELQAAGMSPAQAAAYSKYYNQAQAKAYSGGSSGSSGDTGDSTIEPVKGWGNLSEDKIRQIQWSLGLETTGVWDQETADRTGYKNSNKCYEAWMNGDFTNSAEWGPYQQKQMLEANKINARIQKLQTTEEKETQIRNAYESGTIDAAMAQELLRVNGLL